MGDLFDSFPNVQKCCFCIPLKAGCCLIAILYFLNGGLTFTDVFLLSSVYGKEEDDGICYYGIDTKGCTQHIFQNMICLIFMGVIDICLRITSLAMFIGALIESASITTVFLFVLLIARMLDFMIIVAIIVVGVLGSCPITLTGCVSCILAILITALFVFYFLVVVKSFRDLL